MANLSFQGNLEEIPKLFCQFWFSNVSKPTISQVSHYELLNFNGGEFDYQFLITAHMIECPINKR